ncbi:MAG TPA: AMP-binding protein [Candidatus Nanopelagicales bacterium]|nr:AMP-binding protein [Candidatus Nanopelagicales bacterium]
MVVVARPGALMSVRGSVVGDVVAGSLQLLAAAGPWRPSTWAIARRDGLSFGALAALAARRSPDATAIVDDDGELSCAALDRFGDDVAAIVVGRAERVAVLGRNGRCLAAAVVGATRSGADLVLLNADLTPGAVAEVLRAERVDLLLVDGDDLPLPSTDVPIVDLRAVPRAVGPRPARRRTGRIVVLTSGSTGTPKGAHLATTRTVQAVPITTLVHRVPWRSASSLVITCPLFHGFGLGFLAMGLAFGLPVVLTRRLDAEATAERLRRSPGAVVVGVPPVLARIARAGSGARPAAVLSGAGLLHPRVSRLLVDAFGPVLVNLYGSSEEGWSCLATPDDLVAAPGTIGRPAAGVRIEVLGDDGRPVPDGVTGHLCVGSRLAFAHYTDGSGRGTLGGLADSGDLAHRDALGLLHVDGRTDDMVVTGGENVLVPAVEDALLSHPRVAEARVDVLPDDEYGVRLEAVVVPRDAGDLLDGAEAFADDVDAWAREHLARFERPRAVHVAASLELTSIGKQPRVRPRPDRG